MKRGILKNNGSDSQAKTPKKLVFDESNLDKNEKERPEGGYMKIDEPKTPYAHETSEIDDDEDDDEDIKRVLDQLRWAFFFFFCFPFLVFLTEHKGES